MSEQSHIGAFRDLLAAKEEASRLSADLEAAQAKAKRLDAALWARLESEGLKTLTLDLGPPYGMKRFVRMKRVEPKILNEKLVIEDLKERGLFEELTTPVARRKALKQYVRTLAEQGHPALRGMDVSDTQYISITSIKAKR